MGADHAPQKINTAEIRARRKMCQQVSARRKAELLVESGTGSVGWRRISPMCRMCAGSRPVLMPAEFSGLLGDLPVSVDPGVATFAPLSGTDCELVPVLAAEVALLQARLDEVQAQLDQLTRRPP